MKEIKAFFKPIKLEIVVEALKENGFESVTLSECEGIGSYKREDSDDVKQNQIFEILAGEVPIEKAVRSS